MAGDPVTLPCQVSSDRQLSATITWMFNGRPVDTENPAYSQSESEGMDFKTKNLTILSPTTVQTGEYSCRAMTKLDKREDSIKIVVKDVPKAPVDVYVDCVEGDSRAVTVHWKHFSAGWNHDPTKEYIIQYNAGFEVGVWFTDPKPKQYDARQDNGRFYEDQQRVAVSPWGNYTFRVIARNEVRKGKMDKSFFSFFSFDQ